MSRRLRGREGRSVVVLRDGGPAKGNMEVVVKKGRRRRRRRRRRKMWRM